MVGDEIYPPLRLHADFALVDRDAHHDWRSALRRRRTSACDASICWPDHRRCAAVDAPAPARYDGCPEGEPCYDRCSYRHTRGRLAHSSKARRGSTTAQIVWLYAPTSGCVRSTPSTALNISRMRASETGLSTTTTSSGLFDEARTSPQVPSSTVTRTPLTVTRSRIAWPATLSPCLLRCLEMLHHLLDDAVLCLVGAVRRHCRRAPGLRQRVFQVGHALVGIAVQHVAARRCAETRPSS